VPIELISLVDGNAVALYVAIVAHVRNGGDSCYPSNEHLAEQTRMSVRTVKRALTQLVDVGVIERTGRRRRVLKLCPIRATSDPIEPAESESIRATGDPSIGPRVTRPTEPDVSNQIHTLAALVCDAATDEQEPTVQHADDAPMFEIEPGNELVPYSEPPIGHAALAAFIAAYGDARISDRMRGALGRAFKQAAKTYERGEILAAAHDMGVQRCASPGAVESYILGLRSPRRVRARSDAFWAQVGDYALDEWAHEQPGV
jgi:DNA-binding transcriptional MocR family regulator